MPSKQPFKGFFPKVSNTNISRKLSEVCVRKMFYGGKRWVVNEEVLAAAKFDRDSIAATAEGASVPEAPSVLEDGTTPVDSSSPEGEAFLQKWFCGLSETSRMRVRYAEMDACEAAGVAAKKRKADGLAKDATGAKRPKRTMPVGWRAVQTVRVSGISLFYSEHINNFYAFDAFGQK